MLPPHIFSALGILSGDAGAPPLPYAPEKFITLQSILDDCVAQSQLDNVFARHVACVPGRPVRRDFPLGAADYIFDRSTCEQRQDWPLDMPRVHFGNIATDDQRLSAIRG